MTYDKNTIEFLQPPFNSRFIDITNQQFARLTVWGPIERQGKRVMWLCECICGKMTKVIGHELRSGHTKSCGCLKHDTKSNYIHGRSKITPEWRAWCAIRSRCTNSNLFQWKDYGGRGIKVCDRWIEAFENFYADMGQRPSSHHSIERRDNDGNYTPENCFWATRIEQANNKSNVPKYTFQDKTQTLPDWCRELHLDRRKIYTRLRMGWTFERAITTPILI